MVSLISHPKCSEVLEPSCGKGVFLNNLLKNDFKKISAYEIDRDLKCDYDFVKYQSFLTVPTSEKYDVVIGNPPYIRWKNLEKELKEELENNKLWNTYFNSLCDYLFIFILKSIEHLNDEGELIFICTEYWLNTTHSVSLRNYMCQNGYFEEIYHFKETPLFEKVTASFIIFKYRKSKNRRELIKFYKYNKEKGLPTKAELDSRSCFDSFDIPMFKENSRWVLAAKEEQDRLSAFEKLCEKDVNNLFYKEINRLGEYCDIGNGMVSGLDQAFQISNLNELNQAERKRIINVLKAKDLNIYRNVASSYYIFIQENISEDSFKEKYPHFYNHFLPFKDKLNKRYSYNRSIPFWEFVFPRNQKLFERSEDRIFIPCKERISKRKFFRFCLASKEYYPTRDVTAILKKTSTKESIEYILAYLNNKIVFDWLLLNGISKGDIVEFSETPIASIPFRTINWNSEREVNIHDTITKEVRDYITSGDHTHIQNINEYFKQLFV